MMTRSFASLALSIVLVACDRSPDPRGPAPEPTPTPAFNNEAASRSIMQQEVIAESQVTSEPDPSPIPAPLPRATVRFTTRATFDETAHAALDQLLDDPALPEGARFVLRGHSDSQGSDSDNLRTSRRRAQAVRSYLLRKGIAADRIEVIALGERRPLAPNAKLDGSDDPAGRARNRRVEVEVIAPDPVAEPDGKSAGLAAPVKDQAGAGPVPPKNSAARSVQQQ